MQRQPIVYLCLLGIGWFASTLTPIAGAQEAGDTVQHGSTPGLAARSVEQIGDKAPHNAFPDLIRYKDQWVCAFRASEGHNDRSNSRMRVLTSRDGTSWESSVDLPDPRGDVRDAKLAIAPNGRLMLLTAVHLHDNAKQKHQSIVWTTSDLIAWDGPHDVGEPDIWLWGIAWTDGVGYSIGYSTVEPFFARLYTTRDGLSYQPIDEMLDVPVRAPNESAIVFDDSGTAYAILRSKDPAVIGTAKAPSAQWSWKTLGEKVGGPALLRLPDGRLLGGGRLYKNYGTWLFWINPESGAMTPALKLPSGGDDTGYPGLVWHDGAVHVAYYSTHEGKTSIYYAVVPIPE